MRKVVWTGLGAGIGVTALIGAAMASGAEPTAKSDPAVARAAVQILEKRCVSCHGERSPAGGLRLDSRDGLMRGGNRGASIFPGHAARSVLNEAVQYVGSLKMPPAGKLPDAEAAVLAQWVDAGAPWPAGMTSRGFWAFQPVKRPAVPAVRQKGWVKNPVDAFVLATLERRGWKPSPYADRRTLIRRVTLDLTGLPPTPEEVDAFLADRSPRAYEKVVDRLLASPHYGERMAQHWLDLARYADSDGYHDDTTRLMWKYRDYVIRSFNQNKPFDQFTVEQLAGDLVPNATTEQKIGSAFNRLGPTSSEGGAIPEEYLAKYAVDRVTTTGDVWLGLTVQCAECHDHKYDPISSKEFYQLFAFFDQVPEPALYRGTDAPPTILVPSPEEQTKLDKLAGEVAAAELELKPRPDAPDAKAETARQAEAKKRVDALKGQRAEVERDARIRISADAPQRHPTYILLRGDYRNHGEEVRPAVPAVLGSLPSDDKPNRLTLAKWLVDPKNPLPARVTVNRLWQMLFGRGLVKSADDFGVRGDQPSHPELLDWLATNFVAGVGPSASGVEEAAPKAQGLTPNAHPWDLKAILRLMVTSATYQQASRATPAQLTADPDNQYLARGARMRLAAEFIRDNALAISGLLDRQRSVGGPSVKPYQPGDLWRELSSGDQEAKSYVQDHGPDLYRRGLYTFWKRSILYPSFAVFDAPKRETCTIRRPVTNTPLQAFVTLNDKTFMEAARVFAQRVLQHGGTSPDARVDYAMRVALSRPATPAERRSLTSLYADALREYRAHPDAAQKLVSVGESARPSDLDVSEHAAWTCVCNAILNLDETLTKE